MTIVKINETEPRTVEQMSSIHTTKTNEIIDVVNAGGGGGGPTPSSTVASETSFGQNSAAGSASEYSRGDHTHGSPTNPITAHESTYTHSLLHSNSNDPTADQKAALAGTSGTPSASNKFLTDSDSRNSNARTPTSHSHAPGDVTGTAVITADSRLSDARTPLSHTQAFSTITSTPTTLSGYGITDANPKRQIYNLSAAVATSGTTETKLFNKQISAGSAVVGSTYRVICTGNSSSTGTLIFRVRVGANGTTSDNQVWISTTSAAQVANARAGFDVLVTVRSTTTAIADGVGYAGTVQLPTLRAAPATAAIVISSAWYIDVDCTCSVGTFTAQVGSIEEIK